MKRIMMVGLVMLLAGTMFAATNTPIKGNVADTASGVSATQDYTLNLGNVDNYEIGFSTTAVTAFNSQTTAPASSVELTVADGEDVGRNTNADLYVYWKIASADECYISLSATALKDPGSNDTIDTRFETELAGAGMGTAVDSAVTISDTESAAVVSGSLYHFNPADGKIESKAGSQKISIETESLNGKTPGTYTGTITLTITAGAPTA